MDLLGVRAGAALCEDSYTPIPSFSAADLERSMVLIFSCEESFCNKGFILTLVFAAFFSVGDE